MDWKWHLGSVDWRGKEKKTDGNESGSLATQQTRTYRRNGRANKGPLLCETIDYTIAVKNADWMNNMNERKAC